jgi:O-antigen/teichoic acid export membrane protein
MADRTHEDAHAHPDLGAAAVQGLRWIAIARPVIEIALLGSMVVLARLIPPHEFGRFAVAAILSELALLLPAEGVGTALVQRKIATREHLQAGFALAVLASLAIAILALVLSIWLITPIFGTRTADLVRLSIPGYLLVAVTVVPIAILRRRLAFRRLSMIDLCSSLIRAAACVVLALVGMEAEALVLGGLFAGVITAGFIWASAPAPTPRLRCGPVRDLLGYGLPASLAAMSWVGFRNCDYAIVGARLGVLQAGLYFRAYTLAIEYQKKVSLVMAQIGFPVLARSQSPEQMASIRRQMVHVLTIVLFPLLAILAIVAPVLVPWLFGPMWTGAVVPTQVLAIGGAATLVIDAAGAVLQASGRARSLLGFGIAHFAVYALAVFLLSPLGLTGVAAGAAAVHSGFLLVAYWLILRGSPGRVLETVWHDVAPAGISCLGLGVTAVPAAAALSASQAPALVYLVAVTVAGLTSYAIVLRVGFGEEWRQMARVAGRVLPARVTAFLRRFVPARTDAATANREQQARA